MSNLVYLGGELWHADDIPDDVLMHYGVKGMKWGKRKSAYDRNSAKIDKLRGEISSTYKKSNTYKNKHLGAARRALTTNKNMRLSEYELKRKKMDGLATKKDLKLYKKVKRYNRGVKVTKGVAGLYVAGRVASKAATSPTVRKLAKAAYDNRPQNPGGRVINQNGRRVWKAAKTFNGNVRLVEPQAIAAPMRALTR